MGNVREPTPSFNLPPSTLSSCVSAQEGYPCLPTHLSGASWSPSTMPDVTLLHFLSGDPRLPGASVP